MYDCDYVLPLNKTIEGYKDLKNVTCSYCSAKCKAPTIDSSIGFFDGFKGNIVWTTYGALAGFTLIYQLYQCLVKGPKIDRQWEQI